MNDDAPGKISSSIFDAVIQPKLGASVPGVLVGPQAGVDVGVIDVGHGQVMAVTCDPLFVMPEYGWERAAWFAIHIVASDAATSGLVPAFCALDLNLPPDLSDSDFAQFWEAIHRTCAEIGVAVVTGHTGRYEGCAFPMLGGCTMMALGSADQYLTPAMGRPGDAIVLTKGAAIETVGQLGVVAQQTIASALGDDVARSAADLFCRMSVVRDASVAREFGLRDRGVTAMHDATERGVIGALVELAEASGCGISVDLDAVPIPPVVDAVCTLFEIDPLISSSEGTLVLACRAGRAAALVAAFAEAGIAAAIVGELTPPQHGLRAVQNNRTLPLEMPDNDPFWPAMRAALQQEAGHA